MRWDKVFGDAYYRARQYEYTAKRQEKFGNIDDAILNWKRYADLKESKGSYFLAIKGYRNILRLSSYLDAEPEADIVKKCCKLEVVTTCANDIFSLYDDAREYEVSGDIRKALSHYEMIAQTHLKAKNYFLAADAFEHVAELRHELGMPVLDYNCSIKVWHLNAEYWKKEGEHDDASWSKEREMYYTKLYRS